MASQLGQTLSKESSSQPENKTRLSPYCSDPHCESCSNLRKTQEAVRLHQPIIKEEI